MGRWAWVLAMPVALSACAAFVPEPTPEIAGAARAPIEELREGRRLYLRKCSGCHSLFSVDRFLPDRWTQEVDEMIRLRKVRLEESERGRLLLYLTAMSRAE